MAEVLHDILEAEKQAKKMKDDALQKCNSMIAEAAQNVKKIQSEKLDELKKQKDAELKKIESEIAAMREKVLADNEKAIKSLKKSAEKNIQKAVDFVVKNFTETIE